MWPIQTMGVSVVRSCLPYKFYRHILKLEEHTFKIDKNASAGCVSLLCSVYFLVQSGNLRRADKIKTSLKKFREHK